MESEEEILKAIGNRLKAIRINKGYKSYESFALDHDLGRMQYWRLEKGEANLTMRSLLKVLAIHKMTLQEFFSEGF
ncbi:XRE family transcriptional regulator [Pontibacter sp. JH31]|uniref:XRE family transcriptional regulator n=1 Tax=Pontibacter aquaedesilientis TaxID=2766980 RepID=A0ABR7XKL9_9BACT|nr:XRE family transcriptional regulator [Pontibacter aquaedesilientis]MBD1398825.1 XRE family transcriptional regulator [Pontibacter aquaedesilientis]